MEDIKLKLGNFTATVNKWGDLIIKENGHTITKAVLDNGENRKQLAWNMLVLDYTYSKKRKIAENLFYKLGDWGIARDKLLDTDEYKEIEKEKHELFNKSLK